MIAPPTPPAGSDTVAAAGTPRAGREAAAAFLRVLSGVTGPWGADGAPEAQDRAAATARMLAADRDESKRRRVAVVDLAALAAAELASPRDASPHAPASPPPADPGGDHHAPPAAGAQRPVGQGTRDGSQPEAPAGESRPAGDAPTGADAPAAGRTPAPASPSTPATPAGAGIPTTAAAAVPAPSATASPTGVAAARAAPASGVSNTSGVRATPPGLSAAPAAPAERARPTRAAAAAREGAGHREPLRLQLGRGLAQVLRQGGGRLTLRLQPEALGDLKIEMRIRDGTVAARFEVRSEQAHRLLDAELPALKAALEARGLAVDRLDVRFVAPERAQEVPVGAESPGPNEQHGGADTGSGHGGHEPDRGEGGAHEARDGAAAGATEGDAADRAAGAESPLLRFGGAALIVYAAGGAPVVSIGLDAVA